MPFRKLQLSKALKLLNQSSHSKIMSPSTTWLELVFTNLHKYHLVENLIINTFSKIQLSASCFYSIVYSVGTGRNMYMCCVYIYFWRKVVCFVLFCSYEIHQTTMLQIMFLVSSESFQCQWWGVHGLGSMTIGLKSTLILNDFFTEN